MATQRHNRILAFVLMISAGAIALVLIMSGRVDMETLLKPKVYSSQLQEKLGDIVKQPSISFNEVVKELFTCLEIKSAPPEGEISPSIDTLVSLVAGEMRATAPPADRWMVWHFRDRDDIEKRLRLEVVESDNGQINRELHYFVVNHNGEPIPKELEFSVAHNPSNESLNHLLGEGQVFYRENAGVVLFDEGNRLEFVEKNNALAEINFYRNRRNFHCSDLNEKSSCRCANESEL